MTLKPPASETAKAAAQAIYPGVEEAFRDRYGAWLPEGLDRTFADHAIDAVYAREGLDLKTRMLVTVGGLASMGAQTGPQLKINVKAALKAGATPREITEAIFQMHLYGGMPAIVNAMNTAIEAFSEEGLTP